MLTAYVWLNAKGPLTNRRAGMISARLPLDRASAPVDDDLLADLLALRPPVPQRRWHIGLEENN